MIKYNPKHQLKVGGKMSKEGADYAGKVLAYAAFIAAFGFAIGAIGFGLSFTIKLFL